MKRTSTFAVAICGALAGVTARADFAVVSATIDDLGTLGGQVSDAYDVNNSGTIVGYATDSLNVSHAFYYSGGVMNHVTIPGADSSVAFGINKLGQIVGHWHDSTGDHAYLWHSGFFTALEEGAPYYFTVESSARAIADDGRIVGQLHYPHPIILGFSAANMWPTPSSQRLLYPAAILKEFSAYVEDVDELGRVVLFDNHPEKSYLVDTFGPFATMFTQIPDPPPIAGHEFTTIRALGLHENNGVVGSARYDTSSDYLSRAYYWDTVSPTVTLLPLLPGAQHSVADDINGKDLIVGWSDILPSWLSVVTHETAFIYHPDFGMYSLPEGNFHTCHARALNERNKDGVVAVVGWCEDTKGRHAVRWNVRISGDPGAHL